MKPVPKNSVSLDSSKHAKSTCRDILDVETDALNVSETLNPNFNWLLANSAMPVAGHRSKNQNIIAFYSMISAHSLLQCHLDFAANENLLCMKQSPKNGGKNWSWEFIQLQSIIPEVQQDWRKWHGLAVFMLLLVTTQKIKNKVFHSHIH